MILCNDILMNVLRTSLLYVIIGHLQRPKLSNISFKLSTNIYYGIYITLINYKFLLHKLKTINPYTLLIGIVIMNRLSK